MALQGSLADIALPDVIQLVSVSGKTGVFTLSGDGVDGKIFLRDGQITDASAGRLRGEFAVYEMATWRRGQFIFTANVESDRVSITKSNTSLMMEAARRMDEWRVLQRKIPSMEMVPYFLPREPGHDQITLSPQEWTIVTKIDGQTSIKKLEELTGLSAFDVCKVLYGLVTSGPDRPAFTGGEGRPGPGHSGRALPANPGGAGRQRSQGGRRVRRAHRLPGGREAVPQTRTELEGGKGMEAIQTLVDRLARAISLLEGGDKAGEFLRRVTPLIQP